MEALTISGICGSLFIKQKKLIEMFFAHFDPDRVAELAERIANRSGALFLLGVGKSGCVARKVVATLRSFGEQAYELPVGDLLHGDLGVVRPGDLLCVFSKSGETKELLHCLPFLRARGSEIVAITSSPHSSLAITSHYCVTLPLLEELDPFNLLPTTSTVCQLLFGDLLAMTLLHQRGVSLADCGKNHPAGQIGLRANGKVRDYLFPKNEVPFCSPDCTVADALPILSSYGYGCVCIVDARSTLLGIFTDGDLRRTLVHFQEKGLVQCLAKVMTHSPKVVREDDEIIEGLRLMETGDPVTALPVIDQHSRVVGLLHMHTLAKVGLI